MIMAHRNVGLYQLDECQSSAINKNRKKMREREREEKRREIVKKYSRKLV